MNVIYRFTWKAMWKNRTRTLVTIVGVILSAALFVAVTTIGVSFWDYLIRSAEYEKGDCFLEFEAATDDDLKALEADQRVEQIADLQVLGHTQNFTETDWQVCAVNQIFLEEMPVHLLSGRMPENSSEILLPDTVLSLLREEESISVGETITVTLRTVDPEYNSRYEIAGLIEDRQWEEQYTVVGIYEGRFFGIEHISYQYLLTFDDGKQSDALWHHLFVKTDPPSAAYELATLDENGKPLYGECCDLNEELLNVYGSTEYENVNRMIFMIVSVLILLILLASVNLISNAFAISLSERTKQYGLLSSVGATKKQIRSSLLFEAMTVSLIGVPIGLLVGYLGVAAGFETLRDTINAIFAVGRVNSVQLTANPSVVAFVSAALIAILSVLLSAWIPARKAARISPLEAIRQTEDYQTNCKSVRVGRLTPKLFGLPGVMAVKYFKVSRKKYRMTIGALAFSMVLFIVATYFTTSVNEALEKAAQQEVYDFLVSADNLEILNELRKSDGIEESSLIGETDGTLSAILPHSSLNEVHRQIITQYDDELSSEDQYFLTAFNVFYLEDQKFESFLQAQGIDPAPYMKRDHLTALVLSSTGNVIEIDENGQSQKHTFQYNPLTDEVKELFLAQTNVVPSAIRELYNGQFPHGDYVALNDGSLGYTTVVYSAGADGSMGPDESTRRYFTIETLQSEGASSTFHYYDYDPKTGEKGELVATERTESIYVKVGGTVEEQPFGIPSKQNSNITLLLPLSAMSESEYNSVSLAIKADDYIKVKAALDAMGNSIDYTDYAEAQRDARGIVYLVRIFSACFILLISLISAANVFNTISTNIALRRRDLGMLKSVGMKNGEVRRMMVYECLIYGLRAILWGLPIATLLCYGCYRIVNLAYRAAFTLPIAAMATAVVNVFAVVFVSMLYAVSKLRKVNLADELKNENY